MSEKPFIELQNLAVPLKSEIYSNFFRIYQTFFIQFHKNVSGFPQSFFEKYFLQRFFQY